MKKWLLTVVALMALMAVADAQTPERVRVWPSPLSSNPNQQTLGGNTSASTAPVWCRGAKLVVWKFQCNDSLSTNLTVASIRVANDTRSLETYGDFSTSQAVPDTALGYLTVTDARSVHETGAVISLSLVNGASFGLVPVANEGTVSQVLPAMPWDFARVTFQTGNADSLIAGLVIWAEVYR